MKSKLPTIENIKNLKGKRVVLRLDFNVPIKNGKIVETMRIDRAMPTIKYLAKKKAKVIIISHIGKDETSSLKLVVRYLNKTMNVGFVPDFRAKETRAVVDGLKEGGVVLFENLRIDPREEANDPEFAKYLASFGDIYVDDAFAATHRPHASIVGIADYLPSYAGFLIADEIKHLSLALKPKHPFLFVLGGAKFETKMPLLKKFLEIADQIFIGGVLANDFFRDEELPVGKSSVDTYNANLLSLLKTGKIILPTDALVQKGDTKKTTGKLVGEVCPDDRIVDVGMGTIKSLEPIVKKAKLILWNGPLGFYEGGFDKATAELLKMIAGSKAVSIIGGGDTAVAVDKLGIEKKLTFVSTGGGATLDFLVDGRLAGVDAIINCKKKLKA
ncbi:MAG: phosphoglycerate kinase [Candidatus Pacebacteria bacterium]|nr:phosphoglycerate kinase [Candidatus Paceibacterota bacterium]